MADSSEFPATPAAESSFVPRPGVYIAAEYKGDIQGRLDLDLDFDNVFSTAGSGSSIKMRVDLTNAEFTDAVASDAAAGFDDGECDFSVVDGGRLGDNFVEFESDSRIDQCSNSDTSGDASENTARSVLGLPIKVSNPDNGAVDLDVRFSRGVGAENYVPRSFKFALVRYVPTTGYVYIPNPDSADDLLLEQGALDDWAESVQSDSPGLLGSFYATFENTVQGPDGQGGVVTRDIDVDLEGSQVSGIRQVLDDGSRVTFRFEDVTGLSDVRMTSGSLSNAICGSPDAVRNFIRCLLSDDEVAESSQSNPISFSLGLKGSEEPVQTVPQEIGVVFRPEGQENYEDEGIPLMLTGILDEDDGVFTVSVGDFPWTSLRPSGGTRSAFRISGMKTMPGRLDGTDAIAVKLDAVYVHGEGVAPSESEAIIDDILHLREDPLNPGEYVAVFTTEDLAAILETAGGVNADIHFDITLPDGTDTSDLRVVRLLTRDGSVGGTGFDDHSPASGE